MFARKAPASLTPPPSAAALAATVTKTARHRLAEDTLRELRAKRDEAAARAMRACNGLPVDGGPPAPGRSNVDERLVKKLESERAALDAQVREARIALAPLREAHGKAVAAALNADIAARAASALRALATLRSDTQWIIEAFQAIERAGLRLNGPWLPHQLGELEAFLRRYARAVGSASLSEAAE